IFEKVFDPSSFGYRKGRKTADALAKIWREVEAGNEWIVDADLKDFFGSVNHEKLLTLVGKQIADSRVLKLIQQMLEAGYEERGQKFATPRGTPQGGVVSPLLSNILLTPFDKEMRRQGVPTHARGGRLGCDLSNSGRGGARLGASGEDSRTAR